MNLGEARIEIYALCRDTSIAPADVNSAINRAYHETVYEVRVPSLKRYDVVYTVLDQAYVSLSTLTGGFSGWLTFVKDVDTKIYPDLERLVAAYGDLTAEGEVEAACLEGSTLWYQKVPSEVETVPIVYYQEPETLTDDSDSPEHIPVFLQYKVLVYGGLAWAWARVEDGIEVAKVNTSIYESKFRQAKDEFKAFLGRTKRHYVSSEGWYA